MPAVVRHAFQTLPWSLTTVVVPLQAHTTCTETYHLPFPLLSDPDKTVAIAYGAWGDKLVRGRPVVGMKRMTFLIDAAGTIQRIWSTVKPAEHAAEVLAHVRKEQP